MDGIIGVDIGGTFTDLCYWDGRRFVSDKVPSTPSDAGRAVLEGIDRLGPKPPFGVVLGATVATNAFLQRRGERAALLATEGFGDLLRIGRQNRPRIYDLQFRRPAPVIEPEDCREVKERIDASGGVVVPLDEARSAATLDDLRARGIRDIAVCLLNSFLNPEHERRLERLIAERNMTPHLSCEVLSEFREFERASTVAVNAYVYPVMQRFLVNLAAELKKRKARGFRIMQSSGGQISPEAAARHAVRTILSGPAGGVVAAARVGHELGLEHLVSYDMGGTSTDVAVCAGGCPRGRITTEAVIDGWPIGVPMLDIHTIGAGGGSIAALDEGGALSVGPRSAGADPGPACYGQGLEPTVTDAHVVTGSIRPEFFLGGRMPIHPDKAHAAVERLATRMACSTVEAAEGVIRVANANMERAIRAVTAERGRDPRLFWLVSFGGAGGLHACDLAEGLAMRGVIVPVDPGVLSAAGMVYADLIRDYSASIRARDMDLSLLRRRFADLMEQAAFDVQCDGFEQDDGVMERMADMRYAGQSHELCVPVESLTDAARLVEPFHRLHRLQFGYDRRDQPVEIVTLRLRSIVETPKPARRPLACQELRPPVALDGVPFFDRAHLPPETAVRGPAIVVEPYATTRVNAGWVARVHPIGHLLIERA